MNVILHILLFKWFADHVRSFFCTSTPGPYHVCSDNYSDLEVCRLFGIHVLPSINPYTPLMRFVFAGLSVLCLFCSYYMSFVLRMSQSGWWWELIGARREVLLALISFVSIIIFLGYTSYRVNKSDLTYRLPKMCSIMNRNLFSFSNHLVSFLAPFLALPGFIAIGSTMYTRFPWSL